MNINRDPRRERYQARFKPLIRECRDMVVVYTNALLSELLNHSDNALLDFSEKAEHNELRHRFYEAMSAIRHARARIEHDFRAGVIDSFDDFWANPAQPAAGDPDDEPELQLVETAMMDQAVALQNLVSHAESDHAATLNELGQRLSVITGGELVDNSRIPAGPYRLVEAFRAAMRPLELENRIFLVMVAMFDKFVVRQLGGIYQDFNAQLKEAGVLPHLKPAVRRDEGGAAHPRPADEASKPQANAQQPHAGGGEAADAANLGEELFGSILDLMSTRRRRRRPAGAGGATGATPGAAAGDAAPGKPAGPIVRGDDLITELDEIQPRARGALLPDYTGEGPQIPNIELDQQFLRRIKETLVQERKNLFARVERERMDVVDADTIDLVGMLFEYMLNDPVLPNVAKALLSHLHTPYLKVAILDRRMLTDRNHVARELLDLLVDCGSRWVEENNLKRGIYPEMQQAVDRVLKEFKNNLKLIEEVLAKLKSSAAEFRLKSDVLEKRAKEAARGRDKLSVAKNRAAQEMKARTYGITLPVAINTFLTQTWSDRLIFILLRHSDGELSDDWKDALRVADDLVWAFDPHTWEHEPSSALAALPALRHSIEQGLRSLGSYHNDHTNELFELFANPKQALKAPAPAAAPEPVEPPAEQPLPADEGAMIEKLRNTPFGTWFELASPKGGTRNVKLSWISPLTSTCLFVDRNGVQASVKPIRELAREILEGQSHIIKDSADPFVDRTLVAIRRMLQRSVEGDGQTVPKTAPGPEG